MHHTLYEELRLSTFLLQFYCFLTRGFFDNEEIKKIDKLINLNIKRLTIMSDTFKWDGRYDLVFNQNVDSRTIIEKAKANLKYKQICSDKEIADYLIKNPQFLEQGILLVDLKKLLDIESMFRNGYMLHDVFNGYPEKNMFSFQMDCIDYLYSAAHFYNEGYDYYHDRKTIKSYNDKDYGEIHPFEMRRIQPKEEVMFRNFREAYINLVFFVESFINSVGLDALLAGSAKSETEENKLKGIEKIKNGWKTYSTLKQRIKNFSQIINGTPIDTDKDPIKSYLEVSVELRNQYVHSSADKTKNRYTPDDWKLKCDEMIDHKCFEMLEGFWKGCYPAKVFPKVIFNEFYGSSFKGHQGRFVMTE